MKSYRDLEIFTTSYDLAIRVHHMTLQLPQFELYEEGMSVKKMFKKVLHQMQLKGTEDEDIRADAAGCRTCCKVHVTGCRPNPKALL